MNESKNEVQILCGETDKAFIRDIKDDLNRLQDVSQSPITGFNIVGISVLPKLVYIGLLQFQITLSDWGNL